MTTQIKPLYGLVLLRRLEEPSKSRIITPDAAKKKSQKAEVVGVGPGRYSISGTLMPCMVKVGDVVLVSDWAGVGTEVRHLEEDMILCKEEAILAILVEGRTAKAK
jgi:chaperonin GroES